MFREQARTLKRLSQTLDVLAILAAFGIAFVLREYHDSLPLLRHIPSDPRGVQNPARSDYVVLLTVSIAAWIVSLSRFGVYRSHRSERRTAVLLSYLHALFWSVVATATCVFAVRMHGISRLFFAYFFATSFLLLVTKHYLAALQLRSLRRRGYNQRFAVVIGSGQPAASFSRVILDAKHMGYNLIGAVVPSSDEKLPGGDIPVIGTTADLDDIIEEHPLDEIFVVGSANDMARLGPIAQSLIERGLVVSLVSPLTTGPSGVRGRITDFSGVPMISFGPMPQDEVGSALKRSLDVLLSALALVMLAPVIAVLALLIRILDPGPVLFGQVRLGRGGEKFRLFKFRSMKVDAERVLRSTPELYRQYVDNDYKLPDDVDPRITPFGRFLRKSSLDELPQLWNVLKGDMSLVGPRPIVPAELQQYQPYAGLFLSVRPGLTGHWQVSGRSDIQYPDRAFLDLDYIGSNSVMSDLSIIARTVPAVLRRRGAF